MNEKEKAIKIIERAQKILCVTSQEYSGDGLASLLALQEWLKSIGKTPVVVIPNVINEKYKFLTPSGEITQELEQKGDFVISINTDSILVDKIKYKVNNDRTHIMVRPKSGMFKPSDVSFGTDMGDFDLIIAIDCPSLKSIGSVFSQNPEVFSALPILNISSHLSGDLFGRVNFVDTQGSSSSEALYQVITESGFGELPKTLATKLLTGIISSTGSFLENATTAQALNVSGNLQKIGANQSEIIDYLFKRKKLSVLKVWGKVLQDLNLDPVHRVCWSSLDKNDLRDYSISDIEDISSEILRFVDDSDFSILMFQDEKDVKIELRTNNPNLNLLDYFQQYDPVSVPYGVNILIEEEEVLQVQEVLLQKAIDLQSKRLSLPEGETIQSVNIGYKYVDEIDLNKNKEVESFVNSVPLAPEHIPFQAPFQKSEKERTSEVVESIPQKNSYFESDSKIPLWLRKD